MSIDTEALAPAELTSQGRQVVDGLLELIPQEAAASNGVIKDLGSVMLISCRDDPYGEDLVSRLTSRQYEVVLMASYDMPDDNIGADLGIASKTVRRRLGDAYKKLGVASRSQAGTFIPVTAKQLLGVPGSRKRSTGETRPILRQSQRELLELVGDGHTAEEIGQKMKSSQSAIRSNKLALAKRLGLNGSVELRRVAGALRNLKRYTIMAERVAETLQPEIFAVLNQSGDFGLPNGQSVQDGNLDPADLITAAIMLRLSDSASKPKPGA